MLCHIAGSMQVFCLCIERYASWTLVEATLGTNHDFKCPIRINWVLGMVICLLWHETKTTNWYMLYYNNCCYNCSQDSICGYLHIYDAAAAPVLIEERASLIDGNEGDTGDDMWWLMIVKTWCLSWNFCLTRYNLSVTNESVWKLVKFFILTTRPREFEGLVLCADT